MQMDMQVAVNQLQCYISPNFSSRNSCVAIIKVHFFLFHSSLKEFLKVVVGDITRIDCSDLLIHC